MAARIRLACILGLLAPLAACGDDQPPPAPLGGGTSGMSSVTTPMGGVTEGDATADDTATSGASSSGGAEDTGTTPPPDTPAALPQLGSLVVLGDSISAGGGDPPYYYDLLQVDLEVRYGPFQYQNEAVPGVGSSGLVAQIDTLPATLPGPVAVVISVGGKDLQDALSAITTGTDLQQRIELRENFETALDSLLLPDRFGAGVEVFVFGMDLIDASDGAGDFGNNGCAFGQGLPVIPSASYFSAWNLVLSDSLGERGQYLLGSHDAFDGHGYASVEPWNAQDCVHPNALGHDQLRRLTYEWITGDLLP
jgi:hypothetical protein